METKSKNNSHIHIPLLRKILNYFLSAFFRFLYNEMAWSYDWVASIVSLGRWNEWTATTLQYLSGLKILELGHGPGHLIANLLQANKEAFGIDPSPYMGNIASARLRKAGLSLNLSAAQAQHLPFMNESFDQVVATFPTEYILDEESLREIFRVLTPNGSAVILPVAWITGKSIPDRLASWLFKITGQSPSWDDRALIPAKNAGFHVTTKHVNLKSSEVIIVIASKESWNKE